MTRESGPLREDGILTPSIAWDIAVQNQRERILSALATNCAEKAFVGTTIADIVGTAGISRATFYKHFATKTECFHAAVESFVASLQCAAEEATASSSGSSSDRIRAVTTAILEGLAAEPEWATLLLVEAPTVDPEIVRSYRNLTLDALATELNAVEATDRAGGDPDLAFGRAKVLLTEHVAAGKIERLPSLLPELTYIALLPYVGQEDALEHAQQTA
jgi:AcrR family transcriptional regulator